MSKLNYFGCSLTYGAELEGPGIHRTSEEAMLKYWPVKLGNWLGFDTSDIVNWARSGGSFEDIALTAIDAMNKSTDPDDVFIIAWTWPERQNFWNPDEDAPNQAGITMTLSYLTNAISQVDLIKDHKKLVDHYRDYEGARNWTLRSLEYFYMVDTTAKLLNKRCIHLQMGSTFTYLDDFMGKFFDYQTIPSYRYGAVETNNLLGAACVLREHTLYNYWREAPILFKRNPIWYKFSEAYPDKKYYNGTHWSFEGSDIVADMIYNEIREWKIDI